MNPLAMASSVVLACSAILAAMLAGRARPSSRNYLRLATALYFSLSLCTGLAAAQPDVTTLGFSAAVAQVVCALAPVTLALSVFATFEHPPSPWVAGVSMVLACLAGIGAATAGKPVLSLAPLTASVLVIVALCIRRWRIEKRSAAHAFLSACCLICAAAASLSIAEDARVALILFSAAALLGFALALARRSGVAVVDTRDLRAALPIGEKR